MGRNVPDVGSVILKNRPKEDLKTLKAAYVDIQNFSKGAI